LGIKNALGQFIAFLDSDDQWLPDYLQHQIDTLKQTPTAVLSYCNYIAITSVDHKGDRMSLIPFHFNFDTSRQQGGRGQGAEGKN
jgi:glycosyltransferase involved in cell wall biosynthesis